MPLFILLFDLLLLNLVFSSICPKSIFAAEYKIEAGCYLQMKLRLQNEIMILTSGCQPAMALLHSVLTL